MAAVRKYQSVFLLLASFLGLSLGRAEEDFTFFENKVRPILVEHCYKCHSAEAEKIKGGLYLDSKPGMLEGGDSGPAIVPGKPEESLLIKAVRYTDKDLQMPPKDKKLSDAQIADLTEWVKLGAPDPRTTKISKAAKLSNSPYDFAAARTNWAFLRPSDPPVPMTKDQAWAKSPIDKFILAKLEEKNLKPAPPADKRTLIRRATYDLIGLPPTPKETEDFLADKSPDAFAKVVDRLLASPQYGVRWGRHWLDVVRYTDSLDARVLGTDQDSLDAWRYRDWVVDAFNRDLPYDQFITQQIAGDLLPPPEPDGINTNAIIATGMYAIGNWGNGDADKDKILTDIADDAVDVTGRAFLGLTLACARCHNHKFDPIPTADYYSLAGIFFSSHILSKLAPKGAGEALMRIPLISKAEMERRKQRDVRMTELDKKIETMQDEQISALANAEKPRTESYLMAVTESQVQTNKSVTALAAQYKLNKFVLRRWIDFVDAREAGLLTNPMRDLLGNRGLYAWRVASGADTPSVVFNANNQEAAFLTIKLPAHRLAIHPSPSAGVAAAWKSPITGKVQLKGRVVDVDPNCGDGIAWELVKIFNRTETSLIKGDIPSGGMESLSKTNKSLTCDIKAGEFLQLNVYPKGDYSCDSTMVEMEIAETDGAKRIWDLNHDVTTDPLASNPHADSFGNADVWYFRDLAQQSLAAPPDSGLARWFDALKETPRPSADGIKNIAAQIQKELLDATMTNGVYGSFAVPRGSFWSPLRNEEKIFSTDAWATLQKSKVELTDLRNHPPSPIAMAHGLQDGGVPESPHAGVHDVKIHVRGRYDQLGELVPRRFPRVLAGDEQPAVTNGSGRVQLAKWLASPQNPLTARVMMNRIWQHHFGEGIVRTANNYGKLGTPPTHPELLDYLAHRFIDSGWSIKMMHHAIMLSAVYQQSSTPEPDTLATDPENKWLGRMNRQRLDAEELRDSLLVSAGRLDSALGGPAIRELENTRRTLYLTTIRSDRSNFRSLFDAADPTAIVEARAVSTVAPQALFMMNHPFVLAQVKALVGRVNELKGFNDPRKIEWLYQTLYGRTPRAEETEIGLTLLNSQPKEAPSVDAWLEYCQTLLCANEFVYVD